MLNILIEDYNKPQLLVGQQQTHGMINAEPHWSVKLPQLLSKKM